LIISLLFICLLALLVITLSIEDKRIKSSWRKSSLCKPAAKHWTRGGLEAAFDDFLPDPLLVIGTRAPTSQHITLPGSSLVDECLS
jgi:hypothetical protein